MEGVAQPIIAVDVSATTLRQGHQRDSGCSTSPVPFAVEEAATKRERWKLLAKTEAFRYRRRVFE